MDIRFSSEEDGIDLTFSEKMIFFKKGVVLGITVVSGLTDYYLSLINGQVNKNKS